MADLTSTIAATIASDTGTNSAGTLTQNIFAAHDTTGATWNASNVFLASVSNKSCIAFKQDPANAFAAHATVIGPHTLKCASHVAPYIYKAYTDIVIDGADNTKITSVSRPFVATAAGVTGDEGHFLNITSGTGFTVHRVKIVSVAAGAATCSSAMGTVGSTGGTGSLTDPIYCYTEAGIVVPASIKNIDQIPGVDECVLTTNEILTDVGIARALPADWAQYVTNNSTPVYGIFLTQDEKTFVGYTTGSFLNLTLPTAFGFFSSSLDTYHAWFQQQRVGDSSSPFFFIINGLLVLNEQAQAAGSGPNDANYLSQIQAIMTARSGDTLTYIDLSAFSTVTNYPGLVPSPIPTPPIPNSGATVHIHFANNTEWLAYDASTLTAGNIYYEFATPGTYTIGNIVNSLFPDGSNLLIIPDTASATTGVITVPATTSARSFGDSTTVGLTSLYMKNVTFLSNATSNTPAKFVAGGTGTTVGKLSIIVLDDVTWDNTGGSALTLSANHGAVDFTANNGGTIIANNLRIFGGTCTLTASHYPLSVTVVSGIGNVALNQDTIYWPSSPQAMRLQITGGQTLGLSEQNIIGVGTGSAYGLHSYNGAGTIAVRVASGLRSGSVGLTGGTITGASVADSITGLSSTAMFSEVTPTIALSILSNASTFVTATTSPAATDINGQNRPQTMPWDSTSRVYAGCANANIVMPGLNATQNGSLTRSTLTWTAYPSANHYIGKVNETSVGTVTSGGTVAISASRNRYRVDVVDVNGITLAEGDIVIPPVTLTLSAGSGSFVISEAPSTVGTFLTPTTGTKMSHQSMSGSYYVSLDTGTGSSMVVSVTIDVEEGAAASHATVQGWSLTMVAVVEGLNPSHTASTPTLFRAALDAVIEIVGDRGSPCPDIDVPTYLEEFVPELLSADAVKVKITYKGYPLPTYEFDGCLTQVESNLDIHGNPILTQYTYPVDYPWDPRKAGFTVTQGGLVSKDVNETTLTVKFLIVPGVVSFYGVMDLPPGVFLRPGAVLSATDLMSLITYHYSGSINNAPYQLGVLLGDVHQWKVTRVSGVSNDGGQTYNASMTFQFRLATWDPLVVFVNPDDGKPPADLVAGTGYYQPQTQRAVTFPFFPTITN